MKTTFKIFTFLFLFNPLTGISANTIDDQTVINNMNQALQRAVGQQYYNFQNTNVQPKGNTIEVKGVAQLFGVSNVKTTAVFRNESSMVSFKAEFPQNAKSQNIHQFAGSNLLAFAPSDIRNKLELDFFHIDFSPTKSISDMGIRYRLPVGQMYKPVGNFGLDKITLAIGMGSPGASGSRSLKATFGGFFKFGSSEIRLFSTAATALDDFIMKGEFITPDANVGNFLRQIGGDQLLAGLSLPQGVSNISLNKTIISFAPTQKKIGIYGVTTFGATEIILQPDAKFNVKAVRKKPKQDSNTNTNNSKTDEQKEREEETKLKASMSGSLKVLMGFAPDRNTFDLNKVGLGVLQDVGLNNVAVVVSTLEGAATSNLQIFKMVGSGDTGIEKGVNIIAGLDLRPLKMDKMIGVNSIAVRATLSSNPELMGMVNFNNIKIPGADNVSFTKAFFSLAPKTMSVTLGGELEALLSGNPEPLVFRGALSISASASLSGELGMIGAWNDPLGAKGITVFGAGLTIGGNFASGIPTPIFGISGDIKLGNLTQVDGAVHFDAGRPTRTMAAFNMTKLKMDEILSAMVEPKVRNQVPAFIKSLNLQNVGFKIAPDDIQTPDGRTYDAGFGVRGTINIAGMTGTLDVNLAYAQGLRAKASMSRIDHGQWFKFTGSQGQGNPNADLNLEYANLISGKNPLLVISGSLTILGLNRDANIIVDRNGFSAAVEGSLFGKFKALLEVKGAALDNTANMSIRVAMKDWDASGFAAAMNKKTGEALDKFTKDSQNAYRKAQNDLTWARNYLSTTQADVDAFNRQKKKVDADIKKVQGLEKNANDKLAELNRAKNAKFPSTLHLRVPDLAAQYAAIKGSKETAVLALKGYKETLEGLKRAVDWSKREVATRMIDASKLVIQGVEQVTTNGAIVTKYIVQNGNPLGLVKIKNAEFAGSLNGFSGGTVSANLNMELANKKINASFNFPFNKGDIAKAAEELANIILGKKSTKTTNSFKSTFASSMKKPLVYNKPASTISKPNKNVPRGIPTKPNSQTTVSINPNPPIPTLDTEVTTGGNTTGSNGNTNTNGNNNGNNNTGGNTNPKPNPIPADAVAIFYQDYGYGGKAMGLKEGQHSMQVLQRGIGNDQISSLKVKPGYQVTLFQHDRFGGRKIVATKSMDLTNFNDQASSILIEKTRNTPTPPNPAPTPTLGKLEPNAYYIIESRLRKDLVIDVTNSATKNETNLVIWNKNGANATKNQIWKAIPAANGYYVFETALKAGMAMDVYGGRTADRTNIQLYSKHGQPSQQFRLIPTSDGYFKMESKLGKGKNVDVYGGQPKQGSNINIIQDNGHSAQQFRFIKVELGNSTPVTKAGQFVRIQNRWKGDQYIHVERPQVESGKIQPGWWSAQWTIEPIAGTQYVRIRNRWKTDQVLHIERGRLESSKIHDGAWSAQWIIEPVAGTQYVCIRNRWKGEERLHIEHGRLESSKIHNGAWSAQWIIK